MNPAYAANTVSTLAMWAAFLFFHVGIILWLLYEITIELLRKRKEIIGYADATKDSNLIGMVAFLAGYVAILGWWNTSSALYTTAKVILAIDIALFMLIRMFKKK